MHVTRIAVEDNNFWYENVGTEQTSGQDEFEIWLKSIHDTEFHVPDENNPVPARIVVCGLDTSFMDHIIKEVYPRYEMIKSRFPPRIKFLAYFCLKRTISLKKAYRSLLPEDFFRMGFETVPNYEVLRVFVYEKITRERLKEIFSLIIAEVKRLLKKHEIILGARVGEDATDIRALKHDKEAEYSGYYKEYGYKLDIVHDLDQETLPIEYTPLTINADEGKCLIPSNEHFQQVGIHPKEWKVDGKYATYENIAHLEQQSTHLVYKIQAGWVMNPKGDPEEIQRQYQKYHNRSDFKVTTNLDDMLSYLLKMGDFEWVGAYYRNQAMERYMCSQALYDSACYERSGKTEGLMGTSKSETLLDSRLPRRGWRAFRFMADLSMLAFAFAALIRVQNGVTSRLGNLTYIV